MSSISTPAPFLGKGALHRLASGLEAGVIGGMAMLLLLVAGSMWRGDVWWAPANLLGSTFYGRRAFRAGLGMATVSGTAFHIVITGTVGALFGLACGGVRERRRLVTLGALAGVFWYYLADALFWTHVNPLVPAYAPQPATLVAHVLFGACLGYMGQSLSREDQRGLEDQRGRADLGTRENPRAPADARLELPASANGTLENRETEAAPVPAASAVLPEGAAPTAESASQPPPLPVAESVAHERDRMEIG
jgi:hypothetical protein